MYYMRKEKPQTQSFISGVMVKHRWYIGPVPNSMVHRVERTDKNLRSCRLEGLHCSMVRYMVTEG
jgi:hypothetical protein